MHVGPPIETELLGVDDGPPVGIINPAGTSSFLIVGDHSGIAIPQRLGRLGLENADLHRHIACDIGVEGLGTALATRLKAVFIAQHYSRLVIDCNRHPSSAESIVEVADGTLIPGNSGLDRESAEARIAAVHWPYHDAIARELARRRPTHQGAVLIALHSFTPHFQGQERPWEIGVLHDSGETSFAQALLEVLGKERGLTVGNNQPYKMDATDYTVPRHAYPHQTAYAELEIRQDLIANAKGQIFWANLLSRCLTTAAEISRVSI